MLRWTLKKLTARFRAQDENRSAAMSMLRNPEERAAIRALWRAHWLLAGISGKETQVMGQNTDLANAAATVEQDIAAYNAADPVKAATGAAALKALQDADALITAATPAAPAAAEQAAAAPASTPPAQS